MKTYLVGGAVRDILLEREPRDIDYTVTGATEQDMLASGFTKVGKDFPVFLHPETKHEYTLACYRRKTLTKPIETILYMSPDITIEQDLARRDFTINAMAISKEYHTKKFDIVDPFGGVDDLKKWRLKYVSPDAFLEDPIRVLRAGRFLARYKDMTPDYQLVLLCKDMVDKGFLNNLQPERVWKELSRGLMEDHPRKMFDFLMSVGALEKILPELAALQGVPQVATHHPEIDTFEHIMLCLEEAVIKKAPLEARLAVLLHDLGKGITPINILPKHIHHERDGIPLVEQVCDRLKVSTEMRTIAVLTCKHHLSVHRIFEQNAKTVVDFMSQFNLKNNPRIFTNMLLACECDASGRLGMSGKAYPQKEYLQDVILAMNGVDVGSFFVENSEKSVDKIKDMVRREYIVLVKQVKNNYAKYVDETKKYPFYSDLCARYKGLLNSEPKEDPDNPMHEGHLVWMLDTLQNVKKSETKKHRWLGYVQGVMASKGLISVQEEREATRGIFNGK